MSGAILDAALEAVDAGLSVVKVREDGSKRPAGSWEQQQRVRHEPAAVRRLFSNGATGLGIVCGAISGNLELLEFDDAETYQRYRALAAASGLGDLVERVERGYLERSPSGGVHWLSRCEQIAGNTPLARRPKQHPDDKVKVLIETRGEGGYVVVAPSGGAVHPSRQSYVLVSGGFDSICTITPEERLLLWDLARTFDEMPLKQAFEPKPASGGSAPLGDRPGDDFASRVSWEQLLDPLGWVQVCTRGETTYWRRPGKDLGISASTGWRGSDVFYCWSSSTELEPQRGYGKFSVYALLAHAGDFRAAAAELAKLGYGEPRTSIGPLGITARDGTGPAPVDAAAPPADRPEIMTSGRQLRDVTSDALAALMAANDPPELYLQHGQIVRVRLDEQGRPIAEVMTARNAGPLRGRLERVADFVALRKESKENGGGLRKQIVPPPSDVVADLLGLPSWPFPPLVGTIAAPALRPDGTVIVRPGYDPATGLLYLPTSELVVPPIPDQPSARDVQAAVALMTEALGEFPYANQASRANALAMLVTLPTRPAIFGSVPLGLVNKPRAGAGASLLVETFGRIATGRAPITITAPKTEEETRKKVTTVLLDDPTGPVVFDNVEATLDSASLAAVLTAPEWSDRALGGNSLVRIAVRWTPFATGNNVRLGGDLPRRTFECRLDPKVAHPWARTGFTHEDLPAWVMARRGELLAAVLTIARAWYAADRPKPKVPVPIIGNFNEWAQTVGGILAYAGIEGFLGNLEQLWEDNDEDATEWEAFLALWYRRWRNTPVTVGTITAAMHGDWAQEVDDVLPTSLADAWAESKGGAGTGSFKRRLGRALARHKDTIYGPYQLETPGQDPSSKVARWCVQFVPPPPNPPTDGPGRGLGARNPGEGSGPLPDRGRAERGDSPGLPGFVSSYPACEKKEGTTKKLFPTALTETNPGNPGNPGDPAPSVAAMASRSPTIGPVDDDAVEDGFTETADPASAAHGHVRGAL